MTEIATLLAICTLDRPRLIGYICGAISSSVFPFGEIAPQMQNTHSGWTDGHLGGFFVRSNAMMQCKRCSLFYKSKGALVNHQKTCCGPKKKRCTTCDQVKAFEDMIKDKNSPSGVRAICRSCRAAEYAANKPPPKPKPVRTPPLVSPADEDLLQKNWTPTGPYHHRTVTAGDRSHSWDSLHRVVLERKIGRPLESGEQADHINGNTHDNRRENLRVANHYQQMHNTKKWSSKTSSRHKGVTWDKGRDKWQAKASAFGRHYFLGRFDDEDDAGRAYNAWAIEHCGEFARLNEMD